MDDYVNDCDNLRAWLTADPNGSGFVMMLQVAGPQGEPLATLGSVRSDDQQMREKLNAMVQAYRMGRRFPHTKKA